MFKNTLLLGVLVLFAVSAAEAKPFERKMARLDKHLAAKSWGEAIAGCKSLSHDLLTKRQFQRLDSQFFAGLVARCAIAHTGAGNAEAASWDWHRAVMFDSATAHEVSQAHPEIGLPRVRAFRDVPETPEGMVRTPANEVLEAAWQTSDRVNSYPRRYLSRLARVSPDAVIDVQIVIGVDGRPRQPALAPSTRCEAIQLFGVLEAQRDWVYATAANTQGTVEVLTSFQTAFSVR